MKSLPPRWSSYLMTQPETGMGYQVVSVTLSDGRRINDVAIIESHLIGEVRGDAEIPFEPEDIVAVELTHRRWDFRQG